MSQSGVYSENKLVWWYAREQSLPAAPKQVQLILSDTCNQDCSFCAYRMSGYTSNEMFVGDSPLSGFGHNNPKRFIPTNRALSLIDEIRDAGCLSIQFTGGGEPTVHPDHRGIFERTLECGLRASLVSNGVNWRSALINETLPRFDWVRVSVDAASPESYCETRRCHPSHWDRVWNNIENLSDAIVSQGSPCTFGLGYVVTPESWRDIVAFAELARDSGAHNVRFTAMFSPEDEKPFEHDYERIVECIRKAKSIATDEFAVYDNFGSRYADLKQHRPDYRVCSYQHYTTYIGGDLNLYRCCVLAYNQRGLVGSLKDRRFDEFWASSERKDDYGGFDARGCERCQFNTKNRTLLYVMGNTESDTTPRHLEWP